MCLCDDYAYFPAQATFFAAWGMGNQISLAERVLTKRGPSFWIPSDLGKILTERTMSKHIQTYIQTSSSHSHNYTHLIQSPTEAHTPTQTQT